MKQTESFSYPTLAFIAGADGTNLRPVPTAAIDAVLASGATTQEKREILSSWGSDVHAVANAPAWRKVDNGVVVHIDAILGALRLLDTLGDVEEATLAGGWDLTSSRRPTDDDDDDPPPCPAVIAPIPRLPPSAAAVSLEAA